MEYIFTISHKENSDAHAMDVEVVWMLPIYTKFRSVTENSHQLKLTKLRHNVMFTVTHLFLLVEYYNIHHLSDESTCSTSDMMNLHAPFQ